MADYNINVQVNPSDLKSLDIVEKRLQSITKTPVKLNFDVEYKALEHVLSRLSKTADKYEIKPSIDTSGIEEAGGKLSRLGSGALQKVPELIGRMAKEVLSVDTAMSSLYKATDETSTKYNRFLNNAGSASKSVGRDMSSYISQASEWARRGYSLGQSEKLSKTSSVYSNISEIDDKTAVSNLDAVMKAYNLQYTDALSIVDRYNKLGSEFSVSAKDLGAGMSNAASALSLGGTDINKALAMLTGGAEITQSASDLGNTLKIGQMRIQGMKDSLEALGEESEGVESISKVQAHIQELTKGQVNIMDSADPSKVRDYYDILQDVSKVWDSLKNTEQTDLIDTMFGKSGSNQGAALIKAFQSGQVQKAYDASIHADGSAMQEQEKWMDSMDAKIQQFHSQFQELSTTALDSDFLKGAIDAGTGFLDILTQIADVGGTIPLILGAVGGVKLFKNLDHQKVLRNFPIFLSGSSIDKEMIRWFRLQVYMFGSSKRNQRGVIAGTDAHEYPTKAELATIDVNGRNAEKTGYSAYGNLCANMKCA